MALLRPRDCRPGRGLPAYRFLTCPMNGHQVGWCRKLCVPVGEHGLCGRLAPHRMVGRTQAAIARQSGRPVGG